MALPDSLSGIQYAANGGRHGPFANGGNYYFVALDSVQDYTLEIWKATSTGSGSWSNVASHSQSSSNSIRYVDAIQNGSNIHIIIGWGGISNNVVYYYYVFSMSSDTFTTTGETAFATGALELSNSNVACSLARRSDGSLVALIQDAPSAKIMGVNYSRVSYVKRSSGGTWDSTSTAVDDAGEVNYTLPCGIAGASDKIHFVYYDGTNIQHKSLNSSNTLSSAEAVNDTAASTASSLAPRLSYHDHSGTERITVVWRNSSSSALYGSEIDSDGTPGAEQAIGDNSIYATTPSPHEFAIVADDTNNTVYTLYNRSSDQDLYLDSDSGSGWGTDTAVFASISAIGIAGINIYTNDASDTVLAVLYRELVNYYYDEYVLASSGTTVTATVAALAIAGRASSITPGAITVNAIADVLASAGQSANISNVTTVSATSATLSISGQAASVIAGAVIIQATVGAINVSGQSASIIPGAVTVNSAVVILDSNGATATITPGAVSVLATVVALTISGQSVTLDTPVTITATTGALSLAAHAANIVAGAVTVLASAASLASAGAVASITSGAVTINATVGATTISGQSASLIAGTVTINASPAALMSSGHAATVSISSIIQSVAATLASSGQTANIVPSAVSIPATVGALLSSGQAVTLDTPVSILAGVAALSISGQSASLVVGAVIVQTIIGTMTINGQTVTVSVVSTLTNFASYLTEGTIDDLLSNGTIDDLISQGVLIETLSQGIVNESITSGVIDDYVSEGIVT